METLPKLILTDIDGVWTDGGMYYDVFWERIFFFFGIHFLLFYI